MSVKIDIDPAKGLITITPHGASPIIIKNADIDSYKRVLDAPHFLFCYKDSRLDPHTFLGAPGRYSLSAQGCLYTADSIAAAQGEVGDLDGRVPYQIITPEPIFYLDFVQMAYDYKITDILTEHLSAGGWEPTQQLANYFTSQLGLTAIYVPSSKGNGACMNFYADNRLPEGFLAPFSISCTSPIIPQLS